MDALEWGGDPDIHSTKFSKIYNYATGIMNLIDVVAIMPYWIGVLAGGNVPLGFLRVLRLARVFRIFKLGKYNEGMSLFGRTLHASIPALSLLMFFVLIGVVLFGSIIFFVEGGNFIVDASVCPKELDYACYARPNGYSSDGTALVEMSPYVSIPFSFYWVMVTMTTVGYGDQFPQTGLGKCVAITCMLAGILTLALPITVLGSNFSAEYEKMHGCDDEGDETEKEEEKFWENFASLVANSMAEEGGEMVTVNKSTTRARLRSMILEQSTIPAALGTYGSDSTASPSPQHKLKKQGSDRGVGRMANIPVIPLGQGAEAQLSMISQLEMTILQMQGAIDALKKGAFGGDMQVSCEAAASRERACVTYPITITATKQAVPSPPLTPPPQVQDFSPTNSSSPDPVKQQQQKTVMSKYEMKQGSLNQLDFSQLHREEMAKKNAAPIVVSGVGSVPNAFEIFSPSRLSTKDKQKFHFSPNIAPRDEEKAAVEEEKKNEIATVDLDEAEAMLAKATPQAGSKALDLRGKSCARGKLAKLGKSFRWGGQSLMKKKKSYELVGETHRKLEIAVVSASGLDEHYKEMAFTVVGGGTQFQTSNVSVVAGEVCTFDDVFEYDVPLSTHTGDLLVKNLEVIAHCGEKVVSTAAVSLASVTGGEVELRLKTESGGYLRQRKNSIVDGSKVVAAGVGRLVLRMTWVKVEGGGEHKFGTSFGMLLKKGKGEWAASKDFRAAPTYPDVVKTKRRGSRSGSIVEIVSDAGEDFFYEEQSSGNSATEEALVFPDSGSISDNSTPTCTSPTQSPGRSDTDNSVDGDLVEIKVVGKSGWSVKVPTPKNRLVTGGIKSPAKHGQPVRRSTDVNDFVRNGHQGFA